MGEIYKSSFSFAKINNEGSVAVCVPYFLTARKSHGAYRRFMKNS